MPIPHRPTPSTDRAISTGFAPRNHIATSDPVTPIVPTINARAASESANRPPVKEPTAVATP